MPCGHLGGGGGGMCPFCPLPPLGPALESVYFKRKQSSHDLSARSPFILEPRKEPGRVAQSVGT